METSKALHPSEPINEIDIIVHDDIDPTMASRTAVQHSSLPYELNKDKSLQKKLKACDRSDPINITRTGGGTKLEFQTGTKLASNY